MFRIGLILFCCSFQCFAQVADIIASSNRVDWIPGVTVGVPGGIPSRSTIFTNYTSSATAAQINSGLVACPSNQVVLLGSGTFTLNSTLLIATDGVTLRGGGPTTTTLNSSDDPVILINGVGGNAGATPMTVSNSLSSGYTKGSSNIVASSVSGLSVGGIIVINQNDEPFVRTYSPSDGVLKQRVKVTAINSTTITFWPPLIWEMKSALNPRYYIAGDQVEMSGVEDLGFSNATGAGNLVEIQNAFGCWAKNLRGTEIESQGIYLQWDAQCEVRHCYIFGTTSTADGYAIVLNWDNSGALIEDNIMGDQFLSIVASQISGCAFSFNFSTNNWVDNGFIGQTAAYNCNHSAHGIMDLWEGNVGNQWWNDAYHGSTSHQILWRNYFHAMQATHSGGHGATANPQEDSYWHSMVGNIFGQRWSTNSGDYYYEITEAQLASAPSDDYGTIYELGFPSGGPTSTGVLDTFCKTSLLRFQNYDFYHRYVTNETAGISATVDNSLLYTSKPSWFGTCPWPAFDPALASPSTSATNIPAGYRYYFGTDPPAEGVAAKVQLNGSGSFGGKGTFQ
jgi:hypothetical protein